MTDTVPAFTETDVARWHNDLRDRPPPPWDVNLSLLPRVQGVRMQGCPYGLARRVSTDGPAAPTFLINPVAAQMLMQTIPQLGQHWRWMGPDLGLLAPRIPRSERWSL